MKWAVLRISEVKIAKEVLASELSMDLSRYEPERSGNGHYAQIDISDEETTWPAINACARKVGDAVISLRERGLIGLAGFDIAMELRDTAAMASVTIPSEVAALLGSYGIYIEISVYCTSEE
jgi:hypothetical protein